MRTRAHSIFIAFVFVGVFSIARAADASNAAIQASVKIHTDAGTGSGVIVRSSGVILTNFHVIEDAKEVAVELNSGEYFVEVGIIGSDARRDIAVLKVPGFDLPVASLGNSNDVEIGDRVTVVGSPRGFIGTLTEGVISAKRTTNGYELFQLDAPVSQGSSGGGVFDKDGNLIALAVGLIKGAQNLNFAVPINYARGMSFTDKVKSEFIPGENLISKTAAERPAGDVDNVADTLSSREIFKIIEVTADAKYESAPIEGEIVRGKREMGDLRVLLNDDYLAIFIMWSMDDIELTNNLLKEFLYINQNSGSARVGLDDEDDGLFIGFQRARDGLTEKSLKEIVVNIIDADEAAITAIARHDSGSSRFEREDVARTSRMAKSNRVKLLGGEAEIRVPKAWKRTERSLDPDDGMLTLQYQPADKLFPVVRIIAEPELTGLPLDNIGELLNYIYLEADEENKAEDRVVIASGTHIVAGNEHYWERVQIKRNGFEFFVDFSVYSGDDGLVQFITMDLDEDGESVELVDMVLSQFRKR